MTQGQCEVLHTERGQRGADFYLIGRTWLRQHSLSGGTDRGNPRADKGQNKTTDKQENNPTGWNAAEKQHLSGRELVVSRAGEQARMMFAGEG